MESLTEAQSKAVSARGNVLVTAGAGTGKTLALAARCCALVCDDQVPLEAILIVTFTDAAAAEMRQRIRLLLEARHAISPDNRFVAEQLALLDSAPISTLHGFCQRLLREHFQDLDLDPEFTVLPQESLQPVINTILEQVCGRFLDETTPLDQGHQGWIMLWGNGNPEVIQQLAWRIHRHVQSLPDPGGWIEHNLRLHQEPLSTPWQRWLVTGLADWCNEWLSELAPIACQDGGVASAIDLLQRLAGEVSAVCPQTPAARSHGLRGGPSGILRKLIENIGSASQARSRLSARKSHREFLKALAKEGEFWLPLLPTDQQNPLDLDWQSARPGIVFLLELARDFGMAYAAAKAELGGLDFSDLEQNAMRLLWDSKRRQPTPAAEQWRRRFRFVFVDEYQDINAVQDAIIEALSRTGAEANRFLVGDVKQSIYRFRQADPRIFRRRIRDWSQSEPEAGTVIPLQDNFRSHERVLAFVNTFFPALMRSETAGIRFAETDVLRAGRPHAPSPHQRPEAPRVHLHLLQTAPAPENEGDDIRSAEEPASMPELAPDDREARFVAQTLWELKRAEAPVWDTDHDRPVDWRDMAILLRAPKTTAPAFAREFARAGIPLECSGDAFLDAPEMVDLLNLLRLLDNPLQDLPLLAVLRSPLVACTPDELAGMRIIDRRSPWWTVLQRCHRELPGQEYRIHGYAGVRLDAHRCWEKIHGFLDRYSSWRRLARQSSLTQCLEQILADTGFQEILEASPDAADKLANLNRLLELAKGFNARHGGGLHHFLNQLEAQAGQEAGRPASLPSQANTVRLLSIHRSKGLEFPVVVVANLNHIFNLHDLNQSVILDEDYGVCPRIFSSIGHPRISYPSLPLWLARKRQSREALAEELRLLYVAVTRARDHLLLTGRLRKNQSLTPPDCDAPHSALGTRQILQAKSCLDWLRLWLNQSTTPADWTDPHNGGNRCITWHLHSLQTEDPSPANPDAPTELPTAVPRADLSRDVQTVQDRLGWKYPQTNATKVPAKTSFSRLRQLVDDESSETATATSVLSSPDRDTLDAEHETAAAISIGIAHHTFLQWVALDRTSTPAHLREEATRLEQAKILTPDEAALLDWRALTWFWQSDLGRRIIAEAPHARRELAFTARFTADELASVRLNIPDPPESEEFIVVQGVADLVVMKPEEIWLLDYKTSAVKRGESEARAAAYSPQLFLYAAALEKICQRPVTEIWIGFLIARENVRLSPR